MSDLVLAFVSENSSVAYVFGPGKFSAARALDGSWRSPAPDCKFGDFQEGYDRLDDAAAAALFEEAANEISSARSLGVPFRVGRGSR
jgi:hypothetical protein